MRGEPGAQGMPSASSAAAARRRHRETTRARSRPQGVVRHGPLLRVRWDRLGRVALLVVFTAVAALYLKQGLSLLSTHAQAQQQRAIVQRFSRQNAQLKREQQELNDPATIEREARALGMVHPGERPYVIIGLPAR